MIQSTARRPVEWHLLYAVPGRFSSTLCLSTLLFLGSCDLLPRPGDTRGDQQQAAWVSAGRLVVDTDPRLTVVRMRIDSSGTAGRHDVLLARFDFDETYSLTIGLDFGDVRRLAAGRPYPLGGAAGGIPAYATVACLCRPLRPDSVRGTYQLERRGIAQVTGRLDATLYFTAWDGSGQHATYRLRQRIEGVK